MIARMWRGWVRSGRLNEYIDILERTGMSGYRRTPGNLGAQVLTRDAGNGRTELITLSWWSDVDSIRAFAGDDIEVAKYYPEDDEYLLDREQTVAHFEVAAPEPAETGGFTLTRVIPAAPAQVFRGFVEPELFARWFVVQGYTTPADRIILDPKGGGMISAVLVSDEDHTEIPFTARYGEVRHPHQVQFRFADPDELVTISLLDLGSEGCQLTYRNEGSPLAGRATALRGVDMMLDAIIRTVS